MPDIKTKQKTIGDYLCYFLQTQEGNSKINQRPNGYDFVFEDVKFGFISYSDPNYFKLVLPIGKIPQNEATERIIASINQEVRVVKAIPQQNQTLWLVAEQYVYSEMGIYLLFERLIRLLLYVYNSEKYSFMKNNHE